MDSAPLWHAVFYEMVNDALSGRSLSLHAAFGNKEFQPVREIGAMDGSPGGAASMKASVQLSFTKGGLLMGPDEVQDSSLEDPR